MTARIDYRQASPGAVQAMLGLEKHMSTTRIEKALYELIKIRASQINHCAFCLDMHTADARKQGETEQRLALIAAWQEAGDLFTEQEQAALELTESITELHHGHVPDEVYARAAAVFSERELGQVIAMAVTINAWNRINVAARVPAPRR
jgi:AhpD family alkylhydroperoxidase